MRALLILMLASVAVGEDVQNSHEAGYEKEVLNANIRVPRKFCIDHDTGVLFLNYKNEFDYGHIGFIDINTKEFSTIKKVRGFDGCAVDRNNHVVYVSGREAKKPQGIYVFDYNTKELNLTLNPEGFDETFQLFFKDKLYFSSVYDETAYYIENGVAKKVPGLEDRKVLQLVLDKDDNIFFSNGRGLFCYKKEDSKIVEISKNAINGLTTNAENVVFFASPAGIQSVDSSLNVHDVVSGEIADVYHGLAIAADNSIIYADGDVGIFRLKLKQRTNDQ